MIKDKSKKELISDKSNIYDVNIRMITFLIISIFFIWMVVYCIRVYSVKKQSIKQEMLIEADILERAFDIDLNYATYFVSLIADKLKNNEEKCQDIHKILEEFKGRGKYHQLFGWRKISWVNSHFQETVNSNVGVILKPKTLYFMEDIKNNLINNNEHFEFYVSKISEKNDSLKLINGVVNKKDYYSGYVMLSYDIPTLIHRLNNIKKNHYTNFIILDDKNSVVLQSKPIIHNIIDSNGAIAKYLHIAIEKLKTLSGYKNISYIDMTSGISYYIKKFNHLPFTMIVNIDDIEIKDNILDSIIKKFIEISIFAYIFLLVVISIYKRETYLRSNAEEAKILANRAIQAKTDFLAFTAHEIRSPLGFITTGSEVMVKKLFGPINEKYHTYALGIHENAKVILSFITDILDENQIIQGKFKIISKPNNIINIIENAIELNNSKAIKKDITITLKKLSKLNIPYVICDERRMTQVINNLITNSIKYSNNNTNIIININYDKNILEINIIDQGIGMSEQEIENIFNNEYNNKNNIIDSYGLGLQIVKMLLDAHKATLSINSQINVGTSISIKFPKSKLIRKIKSNLDNKI